MKIPEKDLKRLKRAAWFDAFCFCVVYGCLDFREVRKTWLKKEIEWYFEKKNEKPLFYWIDNLVKGA